MEHDLGAVERRCERLRVEEVAGEYLEAARKERESADAVYTSLTWTREAERFGREAERRFRSFFDTSVAGVMHTLREGRVVPAVVRLEDLPQVQGWAFVNSLRGWLEAQLELPDGFGVVRP